MPIFNTSSSLTLADSLFLSIAVILQCSTKSTTRKSQNSSKKLDSVERLLSTPPDLSTKALTANGPLRKKSSLEGKFILSYCRQLCFSEFWRIKKMPEEPRRKKIHPQMRFPNCWRIHNSPSKELSKCINSDVWSTLFNYCSLKNNNNNFEERVRKWILIFRNCIGIIFMEYMDFLYYTHRYPVFWCRNNPGNYLRIKGWKKHFMRKTFFGKMIDLEGTFTNPIELQIYDSSWLTNSPMKYCKIFIKMNTKNTLKIFALFNQFLSYVY